MANWKKLAQGAAGAAGAGEALNVEDVFSTYLYTGTNSSLGISNGIALGDGVGGGTSTEFDGSSDYLERSFSESTRTQMTFSAWIYPEYNTSGKTYFRNGATTAPYEFNIQVGSDSNLDFYLITGNQSKSAIGTNKTLGFNNWHHILFSINTSTGVAQLYIDDVSVGVSNTSSGEDLKPLLNSFQIMKGEGSGKAEGKVAHVFLDYTYRDLSTTSNRRLFIDADGGSTSPSTLSALSPILYLPMTDAYSVGENIGTGGDFTAYGSPTVVDSGTEYLSGVGQGGIVWIKNRDQADNHYVFGGESGNNWTKLLTTNSTGYYGGAQNVFDGVSSTGFTVKSDFGGVNTNGEDYASWTFRKAPKFFDVVTYTGTGSAGLSVSHNLGSAPGCIIVKNTSRSTDWMVLHRNNGSSYKNLHLNTTNADIGFLPNYWGNGTSFYQPTSTDFQVGTGSNVNFSGDTYVAYLFAHNDGDGDFGPTGDQDIIKCGSYTYSNGLEIDLGFEPQWLLYKQSSTTGHWRIVDNMRGWGVPSTEKFLYPSLSNAEAAGGQIDLTSTGFKVHDAGTGDYIYIAIRRGPMAVPTDATDVFKAAYGNASGEPAFTSDFPVDFGIWHGTISSSNENRTSTRLTQGKTLDTDSTAAEQSSSAWAFDYQDGFMSGGGGSSNFATMWRRAPNFFDVVAFTAGTSANRRLDHNLGVAPEMAWVKRRDGTRNWYVYHKDMDASPRNYKMHLNLSNPKSQTNDIWGTSDPSATDFGLNENDVVGSNGSHCIAYLFATLSGVSKVGSYTGTSASQTIDCGFSSGARFVLIKETSGAGFWLLFDTERGITSTSNDGVLQLNTTTAEFSESDYGYDMLQPHNSGFTLTAAANAVNFNGADFIFYAVA